MITFDESSKTYRVAYSRRPVGGGPPVGLKRRGIKSLAEARRVHADLIIEVNEKLKREKIPTWKQHLENYLRSLKTADITETTRYNREKLLHFHTLEAWGDRSVDSITSEDVQRLLSERLADNSESYRKFFVKCIKGAFQFAVDTNLILKNPTPKLKFKIKNKIKAVLTESQILMVLQKAQEQNWPWYPHYAVALFTGLRNGELYALKWHQVDLEKRQIVVNCSWSKKDGFKSTKSGNDRIVEIPMPLIPLLKELKLKAVGSEFVLPRLARWERGEQAYDLRLFLKANGLHAVRFHDLRASWATWLLDKGVPPSQVMAQGGWATIDTMMMYMRKGGISIKNSTSVFDSLKTHGLEDAKVLEFR